VISETRGSTTEVSQSLRSHPRVDAGMLLRSP
jgi:hypothetical protein